MDERTLKLVELVLQEVKDFRAEFRDELPSIHASMQGMDKRLVIVENFVESHEEQHRSIWKVHALLVPLATTMILGVMGYVAKALKWI